MSHLTILLLIAFAAAQLADIATTRAALRRGRREANPFMAWAMRRLGDHGWIALKLAAAALLAGILAAGGYVAALAVATALTAGVALWNWRAGRGRR